jgi:hypothetical protein
MSKKIKTVTLPEGSRIMFEALAEIDWHNEMQDRKNAKSNPVDKKSFFEERLQEYGRDAFLHSFTPGGEIGSGESAEYDLQDNPHTPRITKNFYDSFKDLLEPPKGNVKNINSMMRRNISSETTYKNRMFRFKSCLVNLVQLYLESEMKFVTNAKKRKGDDVTTAFNYKRRTNENEEQWYTYLVEVEENRYVRLFVATIFLVTLADLFLIDVSDMSKTIDTLNLTGAEHIEDPKKKFKALNSLVTRKDFVDRVRDIWQLQIKVPSESDTAARRGKFQKSIPKKEQKSLLD